MKNTKGNKNKAHKKTKKKKKEKYPRDKYKKCTNDETSLEVLSSSLKFLWFLFP